MKSQTTFNIVCERTAVDFAELLDYYSESTYYINSSQTTLFVQNFKILFRNMINVIQNNSTIRFFLMRMYSVEF